MKRKCVLKVKLKYGPITFPPPKPKSQDRELWEKWLKDNPTTPQSKKDDVV